MNIDSRNDRWANVLVNTPLWVLLLGTTFFLSSCSAVDKLKVRSSHKSIDYQIMVQRATQAAIWAMPAIGIHGIEKASARDLGGQPGDVIYFSTPMDSRHGFLTANNVTPYAISSLSSKNGPIVVEVPAASDKVSFFGSFIDGWQTPIEDVGPPGADKGEGGKYLFLPPGYDGEVPGGYFVYRPATYSVNYAFRPVARNGGDDADVVAYVKKLKYYRLDQAANPPATTFINASPHKWDTLPKYDLSYFDDLADIINVEPVLERDKAMMGLLAGIGISKGQPFDPNPGQVKAMEEGIGLAYAAMQSFFTTPGKAMIPYSQGSQWQVGNFAKGQAQAGFPYVTADRVLIDERAGGSYFWVTYLPKYLGEGSFYLTGLWDAEGDLLDGTSSYKLNVPADTPAKDFWSVIVYSLATKGFVANAERVGLSARNKNSMEINDDGSVDIYFAPRAPKGHEANWIPTGEDFFLLFRLYGPGQAVLDGSWQLGDVEKVVQGEGEGGYIY